MDKEISNFLFDEKKVLYSTLLQKNNLDECLLHKNKKEIRGLLKESVHSNLDLTSDGKDNDLKNFTYAYEYQRYDGIFQYKYTTSIIPKTTLKNVSSRSLFVTSGMGAISSIILAIYSLKKYNITSQKDIYFETYKMLQLFNWESSHKICYIDSIQLQNNILEIDYQESSLVIVDTTCWDYYDSERIIEQIINNGVPCIAVRSHTKLDMLGTEFSKLGSITYYISKLYSSTQKLLIKEILTANMNIIGHLGIWALPEHVPPFWSSSNYKDISFRRLKHIKKSNDYAKLYMQKKQVAAALFPEHKMFILIRLNKLWNIKEEQYREKIKEFIQYGKDKTYEVRLATGFGFDDIVMDLYYDACSEENMLRIAFGIVNRQTISKFIDDLLEFII